VKIGRFTKTVIMSVVILLISAGIALADNINDNIDASGPITLTAGDSSPTNNTSRVWVVAKRWRRVRLRHRCWREPHDYFCDSFRGHRLSGLRNL
jgi:hypothetical protein